MQEDISNMTYPMLALVKVSIGRREFAAGSCFDAKTIGNVNFLKAHKKAQMLQKPKPAAKVASADVPVVKTVPAAATPAADPETVSAPSPTAGAEGTNDDRKDDSAQTSAHDQSPEAEQPATAGRVTRSRRSRRG